MGGVLRLLAVAIRLLWGEKSIVEVAIAEFNPSARGKVERDSPHLPWLSVVDDCDPCDLGDLDRVGNLKVAFLCSR